MKMRVFWDIAPCTLSGVDRRFRGAHCLHHHPDDGGSTHSQTSVYSNKTTRRYIPEDSHLQVNTHSIILFNKIDKRETWNCFCFSNLSISGLICLAANHTRPSTYSLVWEVLVLDLTLLITLSTKHIGVPWSDKAWIKPQKHKVISDFKFSFFHFLAYSSFERSIKRISFEEMSGNTNTQLKRVSYVNYRVSSYDKRYTRIAVQLQHKSRGLRTFLLVGILT
jgi:hypothetical protein